MPRTKEEIEAALRVLIDLSNLMYADERIDSASTVDVVSDWVVAYKRRLMEV